MSGVGHSARRRCRPLPTVTGNHFYCAFCFILRLGGGSRWRRGWGRVNPCTRCTRTRDKFFLSLDRNSSVLSQNGLSCRQSYERRYETRSESRCRQEKETMSPTRKGTPWSGTRAQEGCAALGATRP